VKVSLTLIEELEEPRVNEVRVRIAATGICHTDLYCHFRRGVSIPRPIVLGHEGAGVGKVLKPVLRMKVNGPNTLDWEHTT
jgi:Zn-dependent alcohol dehydrogenase